MFRSGLLKRYGADNAAAAQLGRMHDDMAAWRAKVEAAAPKGAKSKPTTPAGKRVRMTLTAAVQLPGRVIAFQTGDRNCNLHVGTQVCGTPYSSYVHLQYRVCIACIPTWLISPFAGCTASIAITLLAERPLSVVPRCFCNTANGPSLHVAAPQARPAALGTSPWQVTHPATPWAAPTRLRTSRPRTLARRRSRAGDSKRCSISSTWENPRPKPPKRRPNSEACATDPTEKA